MSLPIENAILYLLRTNPGGLSIYDIHSKVVTIPVATSVSVDDLSTLVESMKPRVFYSDGRYFCRWTRSNTNRYFALTETILSHLGKDPTAGPNYFELLDTVKQTHLPREVSEIFDTCLHQLLLSKRINMYPSYHLRLPGESLKVRSCLGSPVNSEITTLNEVLRLAEIDDVLAHTNDVSRFLSGERWNVRPRITPEILRAEFA